METLVIEVESAKVKELSSVLKSIKYVRKVSAATKKKDIIAALLEHEALKSGILKRKNKAFVRYL
jgi:hypothetical protein